ncbi:MAG: endospore germination permease [Clostridiales bacterium]|nr:endospore germination permease [Clostridiales bacterium]
MTKVKPFIKPLELITLVLGSALMFPYTFLPILRSYPKNSDVWVVFIVGMMLTAIINLPILFLVKKFRGLNINQIFEAISGKVIGKIFLVMYIMFFLMCFFTCMMISMQFINVSIMKKTPMWALALTALIPATYAASKGPGVVARISVFITPVMVLTILIFAINGSEFYKVDHLLPILADSYFIEILKGAFIVAVRFSEVTILFVFSYFLKQNTSAIKSYFVVLILLTISFLLILLPVLLTFGYTLASRAFNPYFLFARQVLLFDMIEKVQSLNTMIWFPGITLKLAIYNSMAAFVISNFSKKIKAPIVSIVIGVVAFVVSFIPILDKNLVIEKLLSDTVMPYFLFALIVVIPLVLVIVYLITKKKVDKKVVQLLEQEQNTLTPQEAAKHAISHEDALAEE